MITIEETEIFGWEAAIFAIRRCDMRKGEIMKDIFTALFSLLFLIIFLIWGVAFTLGGVEILWWIFTGNFFHFVSTGAEAAF